MMFVFGSTSVLHEKPYHLCFDTLANELRINIIRALRKGPKSVEELVNITGAEQSRVSHSLKILKTCNYVDVAKEGKKRIYSLKKGMQKIQGISENINVFDLMNNHIETFCNNECKKLQSIETKKYQV